MGQTHFLCKSKNVAFCACSNLKSHNLASGKRANTVLNLYEISITCSRAVLLLFPNADQERASLSSKLHLLQRVQ